MEIINLNGKNEKLSLDTLIDILNRAKDGKYIICCDENKNYFYKINLIRKGSDLKFDVTEKLNAESERTAEQNIKRFFGIYYQEYLKYIKKKSKNERRH